jgi:AcrR family transcriptional regulator
MPPDAAPRRSRRAEKTDETRAELIAAATRVFAREGFHAASLADVAREAGYSTGAIYWHFAGKDDLFLAVYEAYTIARVQEFETIQDDASGDASPRARDFADHWMARLQRDPESLVLNLEFAVHAWRNPELREAFATRVAAGRLALARIIEQTAEARGIELPMPAEDLGTALRELGSGLGIAKLIDGSIPDALFGDFVETFWRLIADRSRPLVNTRKSSRKG